MKKALSETIKGTVVKDKAIVGTKKFEGNVAELRKDRYFYYVYVGKELYKYTANELFAIQVFNAI